MEQLLVIIQQIYELLDILNSYTQGEREELLEGYPHFLFRWFKFTLKPPNRITGDKLRLAIWDTSFWTFWLKFGHKGP